MSLTHSLALTNTQMIPSTISHLIISLTTNDKKRIKTTSVSLPSYLLSYLPTFQPTYLPSYLVVQSQFWCTQWKEVYLYLGINWGQLTTYMWLQAQNGFKAF